MVTAVSYVLRKFFAFDMMELNDSIYEKIYYRERDEE